MYNVLNVCVYDCIQVYVKRKKVVTHGFELKHISYIYTSYSEGLKGPKHEIFESGFFT